MSVNIDALVSASAKLLELKAQPTTSMHDEVAPQKVGLVSLRHKKCSLTFYIITSNSVLRLFAAKRAFSFSRIWMQFQFISYHCIYTSISYGTTQKHGSLYCMQTVNLFARCSPSSTQTSIVPHSPTLSQQRYQSKQADYHNTIYNAHDNIYDFYFDRYSGGMIWCSSSLCGSVGVADGSDALTSGEDSTAEFLCGNGILQRTRTSKSRTTHLKKLALAVL